MVGLAEDFVRRGVRPGTEGAKRNLTTADGLIGLQAQEPAWRRAEDAGLVSSAFDRFAIAHACAEAAEAAGIAIVTAVVGEEAGAQTIVPLRFQQKLGVRAAVALTSPVSQYAPSLGVPLSRCELEHLAEILAERYNSDLLLFQRVRRETSLHDALALEGIICCGRTAPFIDLAAFGSFAAYEKTFSSATRRNRRQRRQKLEAELGAIEFEVVTGAEAEAPMREALIWKATWLDEHGLSSLVLGDDVWREVLLACARQGEAHVSVMTAGGRRAAVELGFAHRGEYIAYLGAFDPAFARFSVGQEQMLRTISWCFEQSFSRYDLLAPDDPYKRLWTRNASHVEVRDFMLPTSARGYVYAYAQQRGRPLAKRLMLGLPTPLRRAIRRLGI
jgi:CelD/BcsL family acetyltransferase involved in cellulose biosynthesis